MAPKIDHVRVIQQLRKAGHIPLVKPYLLATQPMNIKEVNDALYSLYVEEQDHESLAAAVVEYTNFDAIEMAQQCEKMELLQFRRIGAMLYRISKKYAQSIALSKQDKVWDEAISTAAESSDSAIAEDLLTFFVSAELKACFSACLFTCYPLLRSDIVLELAWRNSLMDFAMPFMVQTMRDMNDKLENIVVKEKKKEDKEAEEKKKAEEALASGYSDVGYGGGDPNSMVVYGAGMGGGMGMPQPGYGGMAPGYGGY
jgi:clathrin heavy chain